MIYTFRVGAQRADAAHTVPRHRHTGTHVYLAVHYFCPRCGELWASTTPHHPEAQHTVFTTPCFAHNGGDLTQSSDPLIIADAPAFFIAEHILFLTNPEASPYDYDTLRHRTWTYDLDSSRA